MGGDEGEGEKTRPEKSFNGFLRRDTRGRSIVSSWHFELCLFGLHQVRADLDRMQEAGLQRLRQELWG
jgi:hypothetical protein